MKDLLNTQTNAEEIQDNLNSSSEDITQIEKSKTAPHVAVKINGSWRIALGNNIVSSQEYVNAQSAIDEIDKYDWELITNTVKLYIDMIDKVKKEELITENINN